tara:strand:+ start:2547 stop:3725 length:1179 start_codon:yes stop_codon:yes gene_type:complete
VNVPLYCDEMALAVMMGLHYRLGKDSLLRWMNQDILRMVLHKNYISRYVTSFDKSPTKSIKETLTLKNTPSNFLAKPMIDPMTNELFCVSNNQNLVSKTTTYSLSRNRYNPIVYFQFIEDCILYVVMTEMAEEYMFTFNIMQRYTLDILWNAMIYSDMILEPIVIAKNILFVVLPNKQCVIKIQDGLISPVAVVVTPIETICHYMNSNNLYFKLKSNHIGSIDLCNSCGYIIDQNVFNMEVFKEKNNYIYYIEDMCKITKIHAVNKNPKKIYTIKICNGKILYTPIHYDNGGFICVILQGKGLRYCSINSTEKNIWTIFFQTKIANQPVFGYRKEYVYVTTYDKYIHKINTLTGEKLWSIKLCGVANHHPIIHNGLLYIQTSKPSKLITLSA